MDEDKELDKYLDQVFNQPSSVCNNSRINFRMGDKQNVELAEAS